MSTLKTTLNFMSLVYFSTVRDIRQSDGNALRGLIMEILRLAIMVAVFYMMFTLIGLRGAAIRGNFILYLISGIFLFMTHIKAVGKVAGSGRANNPMLKHAPVSTLLLIISATLSALYIQLLAMGVILLFTHVLIEPVFFYDLKGFLYCFALAFSSGGALGLVLLSLSPFFPKTISLVVTLYQRANMVFSGKMFVANSLPGYLLPMFIWNPLFHAIDQARGFTFINYTPRVTSFMYPLYITLILVLIGMMLEHWARKYSSESWSSRE